MTSQKRTYGSENNAAAPKGSGGAFTIPNTSKDYANGRGSKTTGYGK